MSPAIRRGLAQVLLPASILPVIVLGPGLVRSPETLWHRVSAEVQRLSEGGGGGADSNHRRGAAVHVRTVPDTAAGAPKGKAQR